jgi:hypothetical protein
VTITLNKNFMDSDWRDVEAARLWVEMNKPPLVRVSRFVTRDKFVTIQQPGSRREILTHRDHIDKLRDAGYEIDGDLL